MAVLVGCVACHAWVERSRRPLTFTHKGMNVLTEMYR